MTAHRSLHVLGAIGASGLLLLSAACGASSDAGSGDASGETSASASPSSSASASASASPSPSVSPSSETSEVGTLTKNDIFDKIISAQKQAGTYTFTLTTGGTVGSSGSGEADVRGAKPKVHTISETAGQKVESIVIDGVYYFKGGPFGEAKWLKVDPANDTSGLGQMLGQFSSLDPASTLTAVKGASKVTKVGSEQVSGTATTHYHVIIDGKSYASALNLPAQLSSLLPATIDYDMYVDAKNLTRKVDVGFTIQGQKANTTLAFNDYGKPVSITAPPASQTTTEFNGAG